MREKFYLEIGCSRSAVDSWHESEYRIRLKTLAQDM